VHYEYQLIAMTNWIIGGLLVFALAVGGFFLTNNDRGAMESSGAMQDAGAMMEKDDPVMMNDADAMMEKDDSMNDAMQKDEGAMMEKDTMMTKGSYEAYAPEKLTKANEGDVVLFFRAAWCPTCKVLDADLKAKMNTIPSGLTILDVNYDTETSLKQKYGVTYQHTLVQVDASGNMITKWSGGQTLASIVANVR
jgi:thiol-disulfide isomerase/thioredoxin